MNKADLLTKQTIKKILKDGYLDENPRPHYEDGTPAHTLSLNHLTFSYDISKGELPLTTLRPIAIKNCIKEILWIYQDQSNSLDILEEKYGVFWWNQWKSKTNPREIGQRYGATVLRYDLVNNLLNGVKEDPYGRRHIMSLWQESDFKETDGLKPCAFLTMWNVRGEYLDMCLVQRSSDYLVAGCINQMQYVALLMMVARHLGYKPGIFTWFANNIQIYDRHVKNAKIMLKRKSIKCKPVLTLNPDKTDFYEFTADDFVLTGYPKDKIEKKNPQLKFELGI